MKLQSINANNVSFKQLNWNHSLVKHTDGPIIQNRLEQNPEWNDTFERMSKKTDEKGQNFDLFVTSEEKIDGCLHRYPYYLFAKSDNGAIDKICRVPSYPCNVTEVEGELITQAFQHFIESK